MDKVCFQCRESKNRIEFFKNKKRYDGLQTYCKLCKKKNDQEFYKRNKVKQYERIRKYLTLNKIKLWKYLEKHSCVDCGERNPVVLEFDHREQKNKKSSIAFLVSNSKSSWKTILSEIDKCDIRCANCHRIKTAKQLKWYKFLAS